MQQGPYPPDPNQPPAPEGHVPPPPPGADYAQPEVGMPYSDPNMAYAAPGMPMPVPMESPKDMVALINERDRQKTKITALVVAALAHLVVVTLLLIWILDSPKEEEPIIRAIAAPAETDDRKVVEFNQTKKRKTPSKSSASSKLITANTASPFTVPVVETETTTGVGFGDDYGDGNGMFGDGGGGGAFGNIPKVVRGRCDAADRAKRLAENGGTPECEEAVMKALRWLKEKQSDDGSWGQANKHAMTGLAILAFLGHCETTDSKEFGETVTKAITWLVEKGLQNDGKLADNIANKHWVYAHAIASYALAEAYTMTRNARRRVPKLRTVVTMSTKRILDSQNTNGGWFYAYEQNPKSDTSITGWHIQAVKAATYTKLPIDGMKKCIDKACDYLEMAQGPEGSFGYHNAGGQRYSMTGVGVLGLQMGGRGNKREAKKGIDFILDHTKEQPLKYGEQSADLYAWYYNTLALFQRGKSDWKKWNGWFRDEILSGQAADGSFRAEGSGQN